MPGKMVEFQSNGSTAQGYLARPESGRGPGVIVIQEWWGLVDHIKAVADRFAADGFVALAPDLYRGDSTSSPDEASRLMMALDIDRAVDDLRGAVNYLSSLDAVTTPKLGCVGFCMGGQLALAAGCQSPRVGAVVDFYGVHPNVSLEFSRLKAPVLGLFAARDAFVSPAVARKLEQDVKAAGGNIEVHIYPDVDHAFFNETRADVYDARTAADAWERTLRFFRENLA